MTSRCCGMQSTTCAFLVSFFAIIGEISHIVFSIVAKNYFSLPIAIVLILIYSFVIFGIHVKRPSYLLPACIILIISIVLSILLMMGFILLAILSNMLANPDYKTMFIVCCVVFVIATAYGIFSFIVINKARKDLNERIAYPAP